MDPCLLDISADLDGYSVWLDSHRLANGLPWNEACAAYEAALALAQCASDQLTRTLERA